MGRIAQTVGTFKPGVQFGDLTQISEVYYEEHGGVDPKRRPHCVVRCVCGCEYPVLCFNFKRGHCCKTCSCERKAKSDRGFLDHRLHGIWSKMRSRCYNSDDQAYERYGGRGIEVCEAWRNDFCAFEKWALANGYQDNLQMDRFPNQNGNYEPGNVRWTTSKENNRNRRDNHMVEAFGETKCIAAWVDDSRCVVGITCLGGRIRKGMPPEQAITTPLLKYPGHTTPRRSRSKYPGRSGMKAGAMLLTAFGETKTLKEWTCDPRCQVTHAALYLRAHRQGWDAERAIATPKMKSRCSFA